MFTCKLHCFRLDSHYFQPKSIPTVLLLKLSTSDAFSVNIENKYENKQIAQMKWVIFASCGGFGSEFLFGKHIAVCALTDNLNFCGMNSNMICNRSAWLHVGRIEGYSAGGKFQPYLFSNKKMICFGKHRSMTTFSQSLMTRSPADID